MIVRFSPFLSIEEDCKHVFRCVCGSDSCVKLDELDHLCFYSGNYMCSKCGRSVVNGEELNYYHDCFKRLPKENAVQLSLF